MAAVSDLGRKLLIRPGRSVRLLHAPDRHRPMLGVFTESSGAADVVLLYSRISDQLERDAAAGDDGILWVCYPKRSAGTPSDLSRERCRDAMAPLGWRPVTQVSIDATWSALRFRPADRAGS